MEKRKNQIIYDSTLQQKHNKWKQQKGKNLLHII